MNFDLRTLGATLDHLSEAKSCSICHFSVGSEFTNCQSCSSVGHKDCFSQDLITSHYYCVKPHRVRIIKQNQICTLAQRGQKRQAEKILFDTSRYLPIVTIGDNIRVPIPKVVGKTWRETYFRGHQ